MQNQGKEKQEKHSKYTVSVRIKPNLKNDPVCIYPHHSKFIKEVRPKSILTYGFDRVFEEQDDNALIYQSSLKRTVAFFLQKKINTTILAYGQTGSGKTFTLFGSKSRGQKGLVDFMVEDIVNFAADKKLKVECSFMQIYKEKVTDLMTSSTVQLRENSSGDLSLQNLKVFQINGKEELLALLNEAHSNKIFGNSYINSESSRSHVVFTLQLQKRKFNIVDLCGSEVLTYKFNEQQRDQTNSINLSLFTLNSVISDLAFNQNKAKFIPFRNSTLTRILKESLLQMQKSQIYLFCNVSPEQKHQTFTSSTLRFGQLAIQIDEANNVVEEKVNLSQQKREKKMVSNIIDVKPTLNQGAATYKIDWTARKVKILDNHIITYELFKEQSKYHILLLHAYGGGCDGTDWNLFVNYLSKLLNASFYSVDFPGFGNSEGKKFTSRAEKFIEKNEAIDFMTKLFHHFGFSQKKKVILVGYDLGGAIGLSCSIHAKLMKAIEGLIVLHPTWTDSIEKLSVVSLPTLLLWFPLQNFHLISAGQKMAKVIKTSKLYRLNINPVDYNQVGGYYDNYAEFMAGIMAEFIKQNEVQDVEEEQGNKMRGKMIQENIQISLNLQEQKLISARKAVQEVYRLIEEGKIKDVYEALLKGGGNKPKYSKLVGELPSFDLCNMSWGYLQKYLVFPKTPIFRQTQECQPFLIPYQQVQVVASINLNCLEGDSKYLAYDPNGEKGITHKAKIIEDQTEEDILKNQQLLVSIQTVKDVQKVISVSLADILYLNSPTCYRKNNLGHLVFEDSVTCNYNSNFVKLKILQICHSIQQLVPKMDFTKADDKLLEMQKHCSRMVYEAMDLRHLVHEGIDNTRYTGTDVGKLAYYGQGNCHHLASVGAALLLPFGKLLSWDAIFRAGSFFKTGRQIDEEGNPLQNWNGKPKVNVEDHTWLQIRYKPSYQTFVFDPSFAICSRPLDQIYSFNGRMHISGKKLNFALDYEIPEKLFAK